MIHGFLLLDKPKHWTAHQLVQRIRRLLQLKKIGHTGTLDPLATGLMVLGCGEATKFTRFLLEAEKTYQVTAQLGMVTETGDLEGKVLSCSHPQSAFTVSDIEAVLACCRGTIQQVPSRFSALKYQGIPFYRWARQGVFVTPKPRQVTIHQLVLECYEPIAQTLDLTIQCSKGTYIRSLIQAIGEQLGCGATVSALRRLRLGPYAIEQGLIIDALTDQAAKLLHLEIHLQPLSSALLHWPEVLLSELLARRIAQGQPIAVSELSMGEAAGEVATGWVRLHHAADRRFFGMGEITPDGQLLPRRLVAQ